MRSLSLCPSVFLALAASTAIPLGASGAEVTLDVDWVRTYGDPSYGMYNVIYSLDRTLDGNLILAGNTANYDGEGGVYYLAKVDPTGAIIWERNYGESEGQWAAPTEDGGYVMAGWFAPVVMKTDAVGNVVWDAAGRLEMPFGNCVCPTSDGGAVACGSIAGGGTSLEMAARFDSSGNVLWEKSIGEGWSYRVLQTKDGGLVFSGTVRAECTRERIHVVKLDLSGELQWEKLFVSKAAKVDAGCKNDDCMSQGGLVETEDGGLVVCGWGYVRDAGKYCGTVLRLDSSGSVVWQTDLWGLGSHGVTLLTSVALSADGGFVVCGLNGYSDGNGYLAKLEPGGTLAWEALVPDCSRVGSVLETGDGAHLVAGANGPAAVLMKVRRGEGTAVRFIRGDANGDGTMDIADPVRLLMHLFLGGDPVPCFDAADIDDNGALALTDVIYGLGALFLDTSAPPPPFPECGYDVVEDGLDCAAYPACD